MPWNDKDRQEKAARNQCIVDAIRAGMPTADVCSATGLSRQAVSKIWHTVGDGATRDLTAQQARIRARERTSSP